MTNGNKEQTARLDTPNVRTLMTVAWALPTQDLQAENADPYRVHPLGKHSISKILNKGFNESWRLTYNMNSFSETDRPLVIIDTYDEDAQPGEDIVPRYTMGVVYKDGTGLHSVLEKGEHSYSKDQIQTNVVEKNDETAVRDVLMNRFPDAKDQEFLEEHFLKNGGLYLKMNMRSIDRKDASTYTLEYTNKIPAFLKKVAAKVVVTDLIPVWEEKEKRRHEEGMQKLQRAQQIAESKQDKLTKQSERRNLIEQMIAKDPLGVGNMSEENIRELLTPPAYSAEEFEDQVQAVEDTDTKQAFKAFFDDLKNVYPEIPKIALKNE